MDWKGYRRSDNVDDRRGQGGGSSFGRGRGFNIPLGGGGRRAGGGLSFGTIVILIVIYVVLKLMGIDVLQLLDNGNSRPSTAPGSSYSSSAPADDETLDFVRVVLAQTEDVWSGIFKAEGATYQKPRLVLFSGQTDSACGFASAATGPFYCPSDRLVYLDTAFFAELRDRFEAAGDFAQAYVIAHEVGHHVQNLTGVLPRFNRQRQSMTAAQQNRMSVRVELQADCYAGIWGRFVKDQGMIEEGDLEEALNAAYQIGDDTLQKRSQGYVVPDSFNHGTSQQRTDWFRRGFESGDRQVCNTFDGPL